MNRNTLVMILSITIGSIFLSITGIVLIRDIGSSQDEMAYRNTPKFYIIKSEVYATMQNGLNWVLDYSKNGETQLQAVFASVGDRDAFVQHLESIGTVQNKEELKK